MNNFDVVKKLVGPIYPAGDSAIDRDRLENLEAMQELAGGVMGDIEYVSRSKNSRLGSAKEMGVKAHKFLTDLFSELIPQEKKYLVVYKDGRIFTEVDSEENTIPLVDGICDGELTLIRMSDGKKLTCDGEWIDLPTLENI